MTPINYRIRVKFGSDYLVYQFTAIILYSNGTVEAEFLPVANSGRVGGIMIRASGAHGFELMGHGADIISLLQGMGYQIDFGGSNSGDVGRGTATIGCEGTTDNPCFVQD